MGDEIRVYATPLKLALGEEGVDSDVPVADVDRDGCRRIDRRPREPDAPGGFGFDDSSSSGLCDVAAGMMLPMRGSRILSPDDEVAPSALVVLAFETLAFALSVVGLALADVVAFSLAFSLTEGSEMTGDAGL